MNTTYVRIAALIGFLAVALGTFGAHGFEKMLAANGTEKTWETAQNYHFFHMIVLLVLALQPKVCKGAFFAFAIGILLFSGSLYVYCLTKTRWLVMITPIGGVCFLVGWIWLLARPATVEE